MKFIAWLDRLHLQWALSRMDPMHPDVPVIFEMLNTRRPI